MLAQPAVAITPIVPICAHTAPSATHWSPCGSPKERPGLFRRSTLRMLKGWWLRHAPSCAWWVGTVLPHGDARPGELVPRVVRAEEFYAGHGAVARFQISPGACPEGLDTVLAERGYRRQSLMSLQLALTARVLDQAPTGSLRVRLDDRPTRVRFEIWHAVHDHGGDSRSEWDMLDRVERPCAYACAMIGDDVVAVGRAVADTGWAGVFGMATLPRGTRERRDPQHARRAGRLGRCARSRPHVSPGGARQHPGGPGPVGCGGGRRPGGAPGCSPA